MNHNLVSLEIKKGIQLHMIKTEKFKTNLLAVFLSMPLDKEKVTLNALIPAVLRRGSKNMPTQDEISIALEEMYGATFDCGIDKIGDDQVLKFYLETVSNEYLPQQEDNLDEAIKILLEVVFNPQLDQNQFKEDYVENEKNNLKQIIEGRKDSKATYAYERCIEEMYQDKPYRLYKYGNLKDLETIDRKKLYEQYKNLINHCKIDIFLSGNIDENRKQLVINNENIKKEEQEVSERMDVGQGKLIIGMDILEENDKDKYVALLYNAILGGTPTSKMFQNVREKNSLAYTASSSFIRQKANIFIKCGIDIPNYEKALQIIKEQIQDMKKGAFTDKNIEEAKTSIIATINFIPDEQDTELMYYFSQELSGYEMGYQEYIEKIKSIQKEEIIDLANRMQINTIYFLKN